MAALSTPDRGLALPISCFRVHILPPDMELESLQRGGITQGEERNDRLASVCIGLGLRIRGLSSPSQPVFFRTARVNFQAGGKGIISIDAHINMVVSVQLDF